MPIRNGMTSVQPHRRPVTATTGRQGRTPPAIRRRSTTTAVRRRRSPRRTIRQQLRRAARLYIDVKLRNGLQIRLDIGPAWLGLVISALITAWWPQFLPLLHPLLKQL
jgi:hypothetical protein